jgi:hypothetical protein
MHKPHLTATGALLANKYVQVLPFTKFNHCSHNGTTAGAFTTTSTSTGTFSNYPETIETLLKLYGMDMVNTRTGTVREMVH